MPSYAGDMSTRVSVAGGDADRVTFCALPDLSEESVRNEILARADRAAQHSITQRLRALQRGRGMRSRTTG